MGEYNSSSRNNNDDHNNTHDDNHNDTVKTEFKLDFYGFESKIPVDYNGRKNM